MSPAIRGTKGQNWQTTRMTDKEDDVKAGAGINFLFESDILGNVSSKQKHSSQEKREDSPSAKTDGNSLRRDFDGMLWQPPWFLMVSTCGCLGFKQ